jgi:hypothetical protein
LLEKPSGDFLFSDFVVAWLLDTGSKGEMIYLFAHILHDIYRFFRFNRAQAFLIAFSLVLLSPRFRKNFLRHGIRYSIESLPDRQRHGGVLVARTLRETGIKHVFTTLPTDSNLVTALKVCINFLVILACLGSYSGGFRFGCRKPKLPWLLPQAMLQQLPQPKRRLSCREHLYAEMALFFVFAFFWRT